MPKNMPGPKVMRKRWRRLSRGRPVGTFVGVALALWTFLGVRRLRTEESDAGCAMRFCPTSVEHRCSSRGAGLGAAERFGRRLRLPAEKP